MILRIINYKEVSAAVAAILALLLAAGMTGCVLEDEVEPGPGDAKVIVFTSSVEKAVPAKSASRAATGHPIEETGTEIPDGSSFAVYAYQSVLGDGSDIALYTSLTNQMVTRDGTEFPYAPTANWPIPAAAKLSFFGYYPWTIQTGTPNPAVTMDGSDQEMAIAYTVPAVPSEHIDLMYARTGLKSGYDAVNMNFKHALTWLRFQARVEDYTGEVRITKITVRNAVTRGMLTVLDPSIQTSEPVWALAGDKTDYEVAANGLLDVSLTGVLQTVVNPTGQMLVLPQSVENIVVEVEATQGDVAFPEPFVFSLATSPDWEMNKIVTYEITLTPDGMHLTANVTDWTTYPVNVIHDGQWWLSVNEDTFEFDPDGGSATLTAETNYNRTDLGFPAGLQIDVTEIVYEPAVTSGNEWLTLNPTTISGAPSTDITMTIPVNTDILNRSAKFHIKAGNMSKVINIVQEGNSIARLFARSNIVLNGDGTLTFAVTAADNAAIPANSQGLHFKWGSLVGVGISTNDATNGTAFAAGDVVFYPSGIIKPETWAGIPYYDTENGINNMSRDEFITAYPGSPTTANKGYDAATGKGDICRYISDKGWVSGNWRMPTAAEYQQLYNEQTNTVTIGAYPSYPHETISVETGLHPIQSGRWWGAGTVPSIDAANMQTPPNATVFLPAAGYRYDSNGALYGPGNYGYYWSASPGSESTGYYLTLHSSGVYPASGNPRPYGFAVRCIRE